MLLYADLLLGSFFYLEDGGDMFLRNVGWYSTDYTTSYPRKHNFLTAAVRTSDHTGFVSSIKKLDTRSIIIIIIIITIVIIIGARGSAVV
jgi:hypothetical protein